MRHTVLSLVIFLSLIVIVSGCGSSGDKGSKTTVGYVVDAPIAGLGYSCGEIVGITDAQGKFECSVLPVHFSVGTLLLGSITEFIADSKVYPQDILNISRSNFTDTKLIALTRFLQSLDDDGNYEDVIKIPKSKSDEFLNYNEPFNESKLDEYAGAAGAVLVSETEAMEHLKANMGSTDQGDPTNLDRTHIAILSNVNTSFMDIIRPTYVGGGFTFVLTEHKGCEERGYTTLFQINNGVSSYRSSTGAVCTQSDYANAEGAAGSNYVLIEVAQ